LDSFAIALLFGGQTSVSSHLYEQTYPRGCCRAIGFPKILGIVVRWLFSDPESERGPGAGAPGVRVVGPRHGYMIRRAVDHHVFGWNIVSYRRASCQSIHSFEMLADPLHTMHKLPLSAVSAPPPSAHLSSAILSRSADALFVSGALGIKDGQFVEGTVADRFDQAMNNVRALLAEADATLSNGEFGKVDRLSSAFDLNASGISTGQSLRSPSI